MKKLDELKKEFDEIEVPPELDLTIENAIKRGKKHKANLKLAIPLSAAASIAAAFIIAVNVSGAFYKTVKRVPALSKISSAIMFNKNNDKNAVDQGIVAYTDKKLPVVGSLENLKELINYQSGFLSGLSDDRIKTKVDSKQSKSSIADSRDEATRSPSDSNSYSSTNTQVEGVDEADIVKNDGEYIYEVKDNKVLIVKAYPASDMKVLSSISLDKSSDAKELFVYKDYLVVMVNSYEAVNDIIYHNKDRIVKDDTKYPIYSNQINSTKIVIYNIKDRSKPSKIREVGMDGLYFDSRRIDGKLYVIANKNIYQYLENDLKKPESFNPKFYDSLDNKGWSDIDFSKINYCPDAIAPNYVMIAAIDLDKIDSITKIFTYLGSGENIYCSQNNIYLAYTTVKGEEVSSFIYKFSINGGEVKYAAEGKIPGTILNQFSMDEEDGYLRAATTQLNSAANSNNSSKASGVSKPSFGNLSNNLFILNANMKVVGKIENLASGEKIYSVRFLGSKAYIVTYKTTDPLFVIDLKDPQNPKILGQLKIPGFSNYLQPYDDTHIIGFGKDTEEIAGSNSAIVKGMKIAMFDVTDVNNPVQMFVVSIGSKGTNSPVLSEHKALLFSKEKNLMAFPISIVDEKYNNTFSGAYVYNIDLVKGFVLKSAVPNDSANSEVYSDYKVAIQRIIYINDTLYTIANNSIKAFDLNTMSQKGSLATN